MAAEGKTPILLYGSTTATNQPSAGNLTNSSDGCEIAINVADKNLFFKDSTNTVNTVPIRQSSASSNGWLSSTDWSTFNGKASAFTYTTNYVPYGQGTTTPTQSSNLQFDGRNLGISGAASLWRTDASTFALQLGNLSLFTQESGGNYTHLSSNMYQPSSGSNTYISNGYATEYLQHAGNHYWGVASSGSAGGSVSMSYALQLSNAGDVTVSTGNLIIGTSGKGIDFSATSGTGTSELLADYEEGTWTPVDQSGAGLTITVDHALYTKVGRLVTVNAYITYPATADATAAKISLPYTAAKYDIGTASATTGNVYSTITVGASASTNFRSASIGTLTNANLSGAQILFTISYTV